MTITSSLPAGPGQIDLKSRSVSMTFCPFRPPAQGNWIRRKRKRSYTLRAARPAWRTGDARGSRCRRPRRGMRDDVIGVADCTVRHQLSGWTPCSALRFVPFCLRSLLRTVADIITGVRNSIYRTYCMQSWSSAVREGACKSDLDAGRIGICNHAIIS
eukprot:6190393-Pleurochrysis_carterae.AAC.4